MIRYNDNKLSPNDKIIYKDLDVLINFMSRHGRILPRRFTGLTARQQRQLKKAIKQARILSLLPFNV
jgi:small subunit ribosomal protein S18|uniref:Ribosomal protein S18 n=1 Tax=Galdieria yellowstonensis TaxID=3028027 RepID=A0A9Y1MXT8_9RHOD|nr:ribosomal protein S18 [Galdieria yellowstonensis]WDA99440.1 ribosomal protein S18 [Galdieria yellowstonensis]